MTRTPRPAKSFEDLAGLKMIAGKKPGVRLLDHLVPKSKSKMF